MADHAVTSSYVVTTELADAYFANDPRSSAIAFLALSTDQKSWYLRRATSAIDSLPFKGQTYYDIGTGAEHQERQFPRWIDGTAYNETSTGDGAEVPQAVIDACCEEAIALYGHYADADHQERLDLQSQGVKSYSLGGGYSETFGLSGNVKQRGLLSKEAYDLLKGYISGAVELTFS